MVLSISVRSMVLGGTRVTDTLKFNSSLNRTVYHKWEEHSSQKFEKRLQELTLKKMEHKPRGLPQGIIKELGQMQES